VLWKLGKAIGGLIALAGVVVGALQIPQVHHYVWPPNTHEVQRVVRTLNLSLADSNRAHGTLVNIVSDVNHCRYWPHYEAKAVRAVAARRDRGAQRLTTVAQTDDNNAKDLLDAYSLVLATSRTTDIAYAAWLKSWDRRFKEFQSLMKPNQLCPIDRRGALYKEFRDDNRAASDAKRSFLDLYEKPARKYRAHIWGSKQI
jgi:hypothetical protein